MGVLYLCLKFRLCSKFEDTASGRILYKALLASMGVNVPPPISPVLTPKDRLFRERVQKEERQKPDCSERYSETKQNTGETAELTTLTSVAQSVRSGPAKPRPLV